MLARVSEVWIEDARFFAARPQRGCFVVGTVIPTRAARITRKHGWERLDAPTGGCCVRLESGRCVRSAQYVRIASGQLEAFGVRTGAPLTSPRQLPAPRRPNPTVPTYGPARASWRGEMGGQNFELATACDTATALAWVLDRHPGCVVIDGSDDWEAPPHVRPQLLCERYGITPVAWWHAGRSGLERSGAVLSRAQWRQLCRAYERDFGFAPEQCPGSRRLLERPSCGCWEGEALRIYAR